MMAWVWWMRRTRTAPAQNTGYTRPTKLALYLYALRATGTYYYGEEDNLFRLQGPDGGFHTGYDQQGT